MQAIVSAYSCSSDEDESPTDIKDHTLYKTDTKEQHGARLLGPSPACGGKRAASVGEGVSACDGKRSASVGEEVSAVLTCSQERVHPLPSVGAYVPKRKRSKKIEGGPKRAEGNSSAVQVPSYELAEYLRDGPKDSVSPSSHGNSAGGSVAVGSALPHKQVFACHHHSKPVTAVQFHPHTSMPLLLTASHDGKVCIWDWFHRKKLIGQFQSHGVTSSSLTPDVVSVQDAHWLDDHHIISGGYDKRVVLTDATTATVLQEFAHASFVSRLAVHPDNTNMFVSGEDARSVTLWDVRTGGRPVSQFKGVGGRVLDVTFLGPDGRELVASSDIVRRNATSQTVVVWDVASTAVLSNQIYQEPYTCPCVRAHPTDSTFLVQSNADYIVLFSSSRPYRLDKYRRFEGHRVGGYPVQFDLSPDGGVVASGDANGRLVFYNYHNGKLLKDVAVSAHSAEDPCVSVGYGSGSVGCGMWGGAVTVLA